MQRLNVGIFPALITVVGLIGCGGGGGGGGGDGPAPVTLRPLPDTGITASQCYEAGSDILVSCTSAGATNLNPEQDGMLGPDVSEPGNSDGKLGFSYEAVSGGCVKDNLTGLTWEVKTTDGGLRDTTRTYTHYDDATQPQKSGVNPTQTEIDAATNTIGYVNAVNAAQLCGYQDWRLPTAHQLQGLVDYGVFNPAIDAVWFPNTQFDHYWSSSAKAGDANLAWGVNFHNGGINYSSRDSASYVRLVR